MKALLRITYCFIITLLIPMIVHCQWIDESPAITNAFLDVFLLNKDEGWACGQSVIVKTTDGGENWRRVGTEYSGIFRGIQFVDVNVGYVVGSNGTVLKSIDGGESWFETNVNTNHGLLDLYFINKNEGWVISNRGLIAKTNNGGESWSEQYQSDIENGLSTIHFFDNKSGYVGAGQGFIYETTDGGNNWSERKIDIDNRVINSIHFYDKKNGWMVGGQGLTYRTVDSGANWIEMDSVVNWSLEDVFFCNDTLGYIIGERGYIVRTKDNGLSWNSESSVDPTTALRSLEITVDGLGVIVGYRGSILRRNDFPVKNQIRAFDDCSALKYYPNPTRDWVTIENAEFGQVEIFDIRGRRLSNSIDLEEPPQINLTTYPAGVYIFRISNSNCRNTMYSVVKID